MTLDEAIAISDEIGKGDTERAANNRWLAEKLRILKWVEECHVIDEARRAREEMHGWQTECVRLKVENAKLLEEIEAAKHDLSLFSGELVASKHENAKLRELVVDVWHDARLLDANSHIDGLRLTDDRKSYYIMKFRELGIEHE